MNKKARSLKKILDFVVRIIFDYILTFGLSLNFYLWIVMVPYTVAFGVSVYIYVDQTKWFEKHPTNCLEAFNLISWGIYLPISFSILIIVLGFFGIGAVLIRKALFGEYQKYSNRKVA